MPRKVIPTKGRKASLLPQVDPPMRSSFYKVLVNGADFEFTSLVFRNTRINLMCNIKENDPFGFDLQETLAIGSAIDIVAHNASGEELATARYRIVNHNFGEVVIDLTGNDVTCVPIELDVVRSHA